jgi:hypothetical protein
MLGKSGADRSCAIGEGPAGDARAAALALMSEALDVLDSDRTIPPIIGAQLQMAVDTLSASLSSNG